MAEATATDVTKQSDDDFDDEPTTKVDAEKKFTQADLDRVVEQRVAREKAKYSDYADLKKRAAAAMTDHEKAVNEAEQRGRSAALASTGKRLATAELKAAAAGKVAPAALEGFLEYADMTRFVGDDGEPNAKEIAAAIKSLAASPGAAATNFDGGARTSADRPKDMNSLIRSQVFGQ